MDFKGPFEAALSSDLRGEPYNFSLWDIHTGAQLVVFKGNQGNPMAKCIQLLDNNHFITVNNKMVNVWSIFNKKSQDQKLFLPGRPSVISTSPCAQYLVAGIAEMIYVYQLSSGNLLAHVSRHYQSVSVLRMNSDGTFLFSGGEDGCVFVWNFASLISPSDGRVSNSSQSNPSEEPKFVWQHHSSQVTDIQLTNSRNCITVSTDSMVNLYSYSRGERLFCLTMPCPLWSIAINRNETRVLVGGQDGHIYQIALSAISLAQFHKQCEEGNKDGPILKGHKDKVTNLCISFDGTKLVSASNDSTCKIWDLTHGKLLQDVKHQAPLANLLLLPVPDALALTTMTRGRSDQVFTIRPFKRDIYQPPKDAPIVDMSLFEESSTTIVNVRNNINLWPARATEEASQDQSSLAMTAAKIQRSQPPAKSDESVNIIRSKFRDLYFLAAEKIFNDAALDTLKPYESLVDDKDPEKSNGCNGFPKSKQNGRLSRANSTPSMRAKKAKLQ